MRNCFVVSFILVAAMLLVGCRVDQEKEVAKYRKVLQTDAAATTQPIAPGEPLTLLAALDLANRQNERLAIEGENYLQALIDRHRGLLLINVHHGAMPQTQEIQALLAKVGMGQAGQSLPQYQERLRVMGLLAAMATDISKPTLSHWTHTDVLAGPRAIKLYNTGPNPLNVHPMPFRGPGTTQDQGIAGLETFGAAAFIGREIRVRPTVVPWGEAYEHVLGFVALAMHKNGYVIPDGDTFGDESHSFSYRVHHTAEPLLNAGKQIPCYELEPLLNRQSGFQSPDYVPRDRIVNIDAPQPEYVELQGRAGKETVAAWKAKREMAERVGGSFEVKAKAGAGGGTFGKRQSGDGASGAKGSAVAGWLAKTFNVRRDKE